MQLTVKDIERAIHGIECLKSEYEGTSFWNDEGLDYEVTLGRFKKLLSPIPKTIPAYVPPNQTDDR